MFREPVHNNWFKAVRFAHSGPAKAGPLTKRYALYEITGRTR